MTNTQVAPAYTKERERDFAHGNGAKVTATVLYNYWTNFHRSWSPGKFEIIPDKEFNKSSGGLKYWWRFTTNISPEDFDSWEGRRKRRFMFYMYDIYYTKKAEAK